MVNLQLELEPFISWFQSNGGFLDLNVFDVVIFPINEGGRGVIAQKDIPKGHVLFTIPRSLILSTRTSSLPTLFGLKQWKGLKLNKDWSGLILCMMWESTKSGSRWSEYLNEDILPTQFDTPMFWDEHDLAELEGTSLVDKLGRSQAERSYNETVLPAVLSRADLFLPHLVPSHYSLEVYHLMGSRILSRSFTVESWESGEPGETGRPSDARENEVDADCDSQQPDENDNDNKLTETEDSGEDDEDESLETAMVPMADMLNARYGSENAQLFYEEHELRMVATKPIKAREQIWNTYGDLPNQELLRRYGHVDLLPLAGGGEGNPGDVVEIRADIIVSIVGQLHPSLTSEFFRPRIDWWLEEGGDDVFVIDGDVELPPVLIAFIRLLIIDAAEWEKMRAKGKPPKPKLDKEVLSIIQRVMQERLKLYLTELQRDEELLSRDIPVNKRNAIIVRLGEKRILHALMDKVNDLAGHENGGAKRKSTSESKNSASSKRPRK